MDISVVIPLYNEDESLPELTAWIERVMAANHFTYEIIMVDDGSSDNSWALIKTLSTQNEHIRAGGITVNPQPYTAGSRMPKEMLSLRWTPICRIARTKYRLFIK